MPDKFKGDWKDAQAWVLCCQIGLRKLEKEAGMLLKSKR